jgi:hypothetical protein
MPRGPAALVERRATRWVQPPGGVSTLAAGGRGAGAVLGWGLLNSPAPDTAPPAGAALGRI